VENIPKSRIIVRYEPKMNETNPIAVVAAAKKTGKIIYDSAFVTFVLLEPSSV